MNKGKRRTIFRKYEYKPENLKDEDNDVKMGYLIESLLQTAKKELLEDSHFLKKLKSQIQKV